MSGCFVHNFRIGHSHPFCIEYSCIFCIENSCFLFLACVHWDIINIGVTVLSHTKVHRAKSSVSISNRYQRKSENRRNIFYTFPWYSHSFYFCRQWSFNNMYTGSASFPWVQVKTLFLNSLEVSLAFAFGSAFCPCC